MANILTNAGRAILTGRLLSNSQALPVNVAWGTGSGTSAATDTTLFSESSEGRTAGTPSQITTSVANDTFKVVGTLTASAARSITNAGLFDALTGGNLFVKGDFTAVALNSGDSMTLTFTFQMT